MAPRRKRKVGLTRMDAAVDALRPLGFSPVLVRKCVRDLLKVYGDDGWRFLEEDAYRVLIDTVLEVPETPMLEYAPEKPLIEGNPDGGLKQAASVPEQPLLEGDSESSSKQLVSVPQEPWVEGDPDSSSSNSKQLVSVLEQPLVEGDPDSSSNSKQLVSVPEQPMVEGDPDSSSKQLVFVAEPHEELDVYGQEVNVVKFDGLLTYDEGISVKKRKLESTISPTPLKTLDERIYVKEEKLDSFDPSTSNETLNPRICVKEEKLDDFVPSTSVKDVPVRPHVARQLSFALACIPPPDVGGKKNSNGWICDDE